MIGEPMATFKPWDVIKVPFPYTDRPVRQHRPALVVAAGAIEITHGLLWVLMITSAENRRWDDDIVVSDLDRAGLPAPSVIRCAKIATIEAQDAERIGILAQSDRKKVAAQLARTLAGAGSAMAGRQ
jgi:mRNA interferase MazF